MILLDRKAGQAVRIGSQVLKVLAVQADRVVVALLDPDQDCLDCGESLVAGCCPSCAGDRSSPDQAYLPVWVEG